MSDDTLTSPAASGAPAAKPGTSVVETKGDVPYWDGHTALSCLNTQMSETNYPGLQDKASVDEVIMLHSLKAMQDVQMVALSRQQSSFIEFVRTSSLFGMCMSPVGIFTMYFSSVPLSVQAFMPCLVMGVGYIWTLAAFRVPEQAQRALENTTKFWPIKIMESFPGSAIDLPPLLGVLRNALLRLGTSDDLEKVNKASTELAVRTFPRLSPNDILALDRLSKKLRDVIATPERPHIHVELDGDTQELLHRTLSAMDIDPEKAVSDITSMVTRKI